MYNYEHDIFELLCMTHIVKMVRKTVITDRLSNRENIFKYNILIQHIIMNTSTIIMLVNISF
jgi:hypothetical protein